MTARDHGGDAGTPRGAENPGAEPASDATPRARDLGGGVTILDTFHEGRAGTVGVYLVDLPDGGVLMVETGPAATLGPLEQAFEAAGRDLADVRAILVTHIHLDHAGAAGDLVARTGAPLWVHPQGAPHLIDPSRLMRSARRVFGPQLDRDYGELRAVPADRVRELGDDVEIEVGGLSLHVLHTPGHAGHHVAAQLPDGSLFTGDAAAVRFAGSTVIRPALPPPEVDLDAWETTVRRMRALEPRRLLLTHFGPVEGPEAADAHLAAIPARNRRWADAALEGLRAGDDVEDLAHRMAALAERELDADGAPERVRARHRATSNAGMTAAGLHRYWTREHPEALAGADGR